MKTLSINVPDDLYTRASRRAEEQGTSLEQELLALVERLATPPADDEVARRQQFEELFASVHGFRMTPKIPREDLYDRGHVS